MAENSRIDDLRRRVQKDPASIAFAQLAEECRRAGELQEAIDVCRTGLARHPGYLSARVTLGRSLLELNELDEAQGELEQVLRSAPENLAARRALAETLHRRGDLGDALTQYRAALSLAKNDPDLQETVNALASEVEPAGPAVANDGLSFEQAAQEFLRHAPAKPSAVPDLPLAAPAASTEPDPAIDLDLHSGVSAMLETVIEPEPAPEPEPEPEPMLVEEAAEPVLSTDSDMWAKLLAETADEPVAELETPSESESGSELESDPTSETALENQPSAEADRAERTIAALGQFLEAVHVARSQQHS